MDKFKKRYNIQFKSLSRESAEVDFSAAEACVNKLPKIVEGYAAKDRFNADEFGLFSREIPVKSLTTSRLDRRGIKNPSEYFDGDTVDEITHFMISEIKDSSAEQCGVEEDDDFEEVVAPILSYKEAMDNIDAMQRYAAEKVPEAIRG